MYQRDMLLFHSLEELICPQAGGGSVFYLIANTISQLNIDLNCVGSCDEVAQLDADLASTKT